MPVGMNSEDMLGLDALRRFVAGRAEDWYLYANKIRHRSTRNGDLRLVIGHDKTAAWGMATFQRFLQLGVTGQGDGAKEPCFFKFRSRDAEPQGRRSRYRLGGKYYWEYCAPSGFVRTGPSVPLSGGQFEGPEQGQFSDEASHENQTLFVRTMNITLQDWVWSGMVNRWSQTRILPIYFRTLIERTSLDSQVRLHARASSAKNLTLSRIQRCLQKQDQGQR